MLEVADDYADLPQPIKLYVGPREYLFMPDAQKARLIEEECEPEY